MPWRVRSNIGSSSMTRGRYCRPENNIFLRMQQADPLLSRNKQNRARNGRKVVSERRQQKENNQRDEVASEGRRAKEEDPAARVINRTEDDQGRGYGEMKRHDHNE